MTAIRKVKAFIANGEIGNFLVTHRQRQRHPVMEGRVLDFVIRNIAITVCMGNMAYFTPPSFRN